MRDVDYVVRMMELLAEAERGLWAKLATNPPTDLNMHSNLMTTGMKLGLDRSVVIQKLGGGPGQLIYLNDSTAPEPAAYLSETYPGSREALEAGATPDLLVMVS